MRSSDLLPLPHQTDAAHQLVNAGPSGILADDIGLGKTCTSVVWAELFADKVIVVAPKEVTSNLLTEIRKWTGRFLIDLRNKPKRQRDALLESLRVLPRFIALINFEGWSRDSDLIAGLISLQADAVIVDEAHHANNPRTRTYKGLREIVYAVNECPECGQYVEPKYRCNRQTCVEVSHKNRFRYCFNCGHPQGLISAPACSCGCRIDKRLKDSRSVKGVLPITGTPIINKPDDLFPLLHLIDATGFPSAKKYRDEYVDASTPGRSVFKDGAQERLLRSIGNRYIQRTRADAGVIVPPQDIEVLEYEKDLVRYPRQWEAYEQIEKAFAVALADDVIPITEIVVQITRLRQMITWPDGIRLEDRYGATRTLDIGNSQKLDICEEKIREYAEAGHRVIAFSHFKAPLRELAKRLGETSIVYDGDTPQSVRQAIRADFSGPRSHPRWQILLGNYRSIGESVTLIGATQTVIIDSEWSPAKASQAYGRTHRLGQTEETRVHIPRIVDTIDTWLAKLNEYKDSMSSEFHALGDYQSEILKALRQEL